MSFNFLKLQVIYPGEKRTLFLDPLGESSNDMKTCLDITRYGNLLKINILTCKNVHCQLKIVNDQCYGVLHSLLCWKEALTSYLHQHKKTMLFCMWQDYYVMLSLLMSSGHSCERKGAMCQGGGVRRSSIPYKEMQHLVEFLPWKYVCHLEQCPQHHIILYYTKHFQLNW